MNNGSLELYFTLSAGLSLLAMAAEAAGFFLCLSFRRLSRWTILVASGFAGMFASGASGRLLTSLDRDWLGRVLVLGGGIDLLSTIAVVGGLWMTFVDFRRRLAMALEPKDGRR